MDFNYPIATPPVTQDVSEMTHYKRMTEIKTITLVDAAAGKWTSEGEGGAVVATGVTIPATRDGWAVANALLPFVRANVLVLASLQEHPLDLLLEAVDPNGTDLMGQPIDGGEVVCEFRVIGSEITSMVPR